MTKIVLFLVGCAVVLTASAYAWPWLAPAYAQLQIFFIKPLVSAELQLAVDEGGIAVYDEKKLLTRREFLSFGGLGLTLALWLLTPGLGWRRRVLWGALSLGVLFLVQVLVLWGLIAFAESVTSGHATGLYTLLYSFIAVSDWVVPVLLWGIVLLSYRFWGSGAMP